MKGKEIICKSSMILGIMVLVLGVLLSGCAQKDHLPVRSNLIYKEGDVVNLRVENFLDTSVSPEVLKKAVLYSPLLNRKNYTVDENCNVVSKGKDHLECGTYEVSIAYNEQVKTIRFQVVKA